MNEYVSDDSVPARILGLQAESRVFIESQPRHLLGSLTAPLHLVTGFNAMELHHYETSYVIGDIGAFSTEINQKLAEANRNNHIDYRKKLMSAQRDDIMEYCLAEIILWWRRGTSTMRECAEYRTENMSYETEAILNRFETVILRPEVLRFYELGFIDDDVINNAIQNGIDAELLLRTL